MCNSNVNLHAIVVTLTGYLYEPAHEIMVLFILRKFILQTRMRSHPVGLQVWFLVRPFVYFHTLCVRTAKALGRLRIRGCAVSPESLLFAYAISTIISWAGSSDEMIRRSRFRLSRRFIIISFLQSSVFFQWVQGLDFFCHIFSSRYQPFNLCRVRDVFLFHKGFLEFLIEVVGAQRVVSAQVQQLEKEGSPNQTSPSPRRENLSSWVASK